MACLCHLKAIRDTPNLSKTESKWVNEQTSLTGGTVDIKVEDKTILTGAVIASTTGDLTLETGSLEYSNIKDRDKSFNVGGGANFGSTETSKGDKTTYSANANYGFSDKKQTNFATIGDGTIIVKDEETDLTKLNRDLTVAQYNTKEGGLKGGFTIDNTTVEFLSDIDGTIINTANEVKKGSLTAYSIGEGAVKATATGIDKGLGVEGTIKAIENSYNDVSTIIAIAENKQLAQKIDGALENDAATLEGSVNEVSEILQKADGASDDEISHVTLYQGNETGNDMSGYAAAYDQNTNETYLNTEETDISLGGAIIKSIVTEAQRKDNYYNKLGLIFEQQTELAYFRGQQAEVLWNRFSDTASLVSNVDGKLNWNLSYSDSEIIKSGNAKVDETDTSSVVPLHFGKRPLDNGKAVWLGTNPIDDALNLELLHEHMFFDDGTNENIGFGPGGRFRDDNPELKGYHYEEKYYDDKLMREALKNVVDGEYSKLFNNCQDWAEKARNEYQKLYDNLPVEEKAKVDHNVRVLEIKNTINKLLKSDKVNEE